jgi:hypothetical protein
VLTRSQETMRPVLARHARDARASLSGRGMALRNATVSASAPAIEVAGNSIGNRTSQ